MPHRPPDQPSPPYPPSLPPPACDNGGTYFDGTCYTLTDTGVSCMSQCGSLWAVDVARTKLASTHPQIIDELARTYNLAPGSKRHSFDESPSCEPGHLFVYLEDMGTWDCYDGETLVTLGTNFRSPCLCYAGEDAGDMVPAFPGLSAILTGTFFGLLAVPASIVVGRLATSGQLPNMLLGSEREWLLRGAALRLLDKGADVLVLIYFASVPELWGYMLASLAMFLVCAAASLVFAKSDSPLELHVGDRVRIKSSNTLGIVEKRDLGDDGKYTLTIAPSDDSPRTVSATQLHLPPTPPTQPIPTPYLSRPTSSASNSTNSQPASPTGARACSKPA